MWRGQWEDLESQARILGGELLKFWERELGGGSELFLRRDSQAVSGGYAASQAGKRV